MGTGTAPTRRPGGRVPCRLHPAEWWRAGSTRVARMSGEAKRRADTYLKGGLRFPLHGLGTRRRGWRCRCRALHSRRQQMFYHVANIGDAAASRSIPATTTHSQLDVEEQAIPASRSRATRAAVHRHRAYRSTSWPISPRRRRPPAIWRRRRRHAASAPLPARRMRRNRRDAATRRSWWPNHRLSGRRPDLGRCSWQEGGWRGSMFALRVPG